MQWWHLKTVPKPIETVPDDPRELVRCVQNLMADASDEDRDVLLLVDCALRLAEPAEAWNETGNPTPYETEVLRAARRVVERIASTDRFVYNECRPQNAPRYLR